MTLKTDVPWYNYYTCTCAGQPRLTIQHFLLDCKLPKATELRHEMRKHLIELQPKFTDDEYFNNMNHLLYPHLEYSSKELKKFENLVTEIDV